MIRSSLYLIILFILTIGLTACVNGRVSNESKMHSVTDGIGANIFARRITKQEIEKMASLGIKYARINLVYKDVMKNGFFKPVSNASLSPDEIIYLLRKNKINIILIVASYGYTDPKSVQPVREDDIENFISFVRKFTKRYGKDIKFFEIWNEPDLVYNTSFWSPAPNPEEYTNLALKLCKEIKQVRSDAKVIGPGLAHPPGTKENIMLYNKLGKDYLQTITDRNIFTCLDGVSIHPYTPFPEDLSKIYDGTRKIVGENTPIISSELGWSSYIKNGVVKVSPLLQGDYFIRRLLIDHKEHVTPSIWYQWHSNGEDPQEREHGFGMTNFDKSDQPIISRLKEFYSTMKGYSFDHEIPCGKDNYVWSFKRGKEQKLAVWNGNNDAVKISINNHKVIANSRPLFLNIQDDSLSCSVLN